MLDHCLDFDRSQIRQNAIEIFGKNAVANKLQEFYNYVKY
jgi:hypothetical protein